jgi:hypothetical protein
MKDLEEKNVGDVEHPDFMLRAKLSRLAEDLFDHRVVLEVPVDARLMRFGVSNGKCNGRCSNSQYMHTWGNDISWAPATPCRSPSLRGAARYAARCSKPRYDARLRHEYGDILLERLVVLLEPLPNELLIALQARVLDVLGQRPQVGDVLFGEVIQLAVRLLGSSLREVGPHWGGDEGAAGQAGCGESNCKPARPIAYHLHHQRRVEKIVQLRREELESEVSVLGEDVCGKVVVLVLAV